jgi:hypothetical protein
MMSATHAVDTGQYAKCVKASKRIRWDIDADLIRGRTFDFKQKFLPDGLSRADQLDFLTPDEQRLMSQLQGRTYANMFGMVERFIGIKMLQVSHDHWLGDQVALEALVRFTDEELKHQELFRRIEQMIAPGMPAGYTFVPDPNEVATVVLGKSTWAVLALTCCIELFTQVHYRRSIEPDAHLSELYKDVFLFHWREESQHAMLDELEWKRENARLDDAARDRAVADLIELVGAVDGIVRTIAAADAQYFLGACGRSFTAGEIERVERGLLQAYRWQFIVSGVQHPQFTDVLGAMISEAQGRRINEALAPLM